MRRFIVLLATSSIISMNAGAAERTATPIRNLPDRGSVIVSGAVEKVKNEREFSLRDNSGSINIKLIGSDSVVLKQGDKVTVTGNVERPWLGLMGKDIAATSVQVNKNVAQAASDAVTKATGAVVETPKAAQVSTLPEEGMVKLSGKVEDVDSEKQFTLRDDTGKVEVKVQSSENVVLAKGAEVTVTGYVDKGALGKSISATHVMVTADATAPANRAAVQ